MSGDVRKVFHLPDVGEGLVEARVEQFLVDVGDTVEALAPVIEVETDKAVVELTSPWAGVVAELLAQADDWVEVGGPLIAITVES